MARLGRSYENIRLDYVPFGILYPPSGAPSYVPVVTTQAATSIGQTTVTFNGTITDTGGGTDTVRGFEYSTTTTVDRTYSESGSFSAAAFTGAITDLMPGTLYYYRAYATNSLGTGYGDWVSFTTSAATYAVVINGVDRTADVIQASITVTDIINDQQDSCTFSMMDINSLGFPVTDQEITITLNDGTKIFGGYIISYTLSKQSTGGVLAQYSCTDYTRLLDRALVHSSYTSMTDAAIITSILATYCAGFGITTTNVLTGVTIDQISFNYLQPSQCFRKIAELTGRNWYIDYNKDIHYFPLATSVTPFNIDSSNNQYIDLQLSKDASQIKNRVYVRGGTYLSDATFYETKGDGAVKKFVLPDKPHSVTVKVNGTTKTLGIKNINTSGFDYYLNYEEKYVEQDSAATVLATTDTLRVEYSYDIPILVAVENAASIATNGTKEFAIFDKSISTTQAARDRASAELTDYANSIIEGSFSTYTTGFTSGQYININLSEYGVNDNYIVQKVVAHSFGAGNYLYQVYIASAKTMGIIKFLIELLEANKNLIELNSNEVVDNLYSITDSLLSDSITDSLIIDSAGPYSTWCTDSLQATPVTRARWDLFQWWG